MLALSIKDAPAATESVPDTEAPESSGPPGPVNAEAPSTSDGGAMSSGIEPGDSDAERPGNLTVNVAATSVRLAWSAPDEAFDSFLVELSASSAAARPHSSTLPGNTRTAEIEGLSPSTVYNITIRGLLEGKRSLPLTVFATTGTWSKVFVNTSHQLRMATHCFIYLCIYYRYTSYIPQPRILKFIVISTS